MDLRTLLLKFYFNVESAYYEFLDVIDNYAPVYEYLVNPLENRGYPSFPVYSVLALVVIVVLFFYASASQVNLGQLSISVSSSGASLPGAKVILSAPAGGDALKTVAAGVTGVEGSVSFVGVPVSALRISVEKQGFEDKDTAFAAFPSEPLEIQLEPTSETSEQLAATMQAWESVGAELEKLSAAGNPEFIDAIRREAEIQQPPSQQGVNG